MTPQDPDTLRLMIVMGLILVPLAILRGDQLIWRGAVLLGALALIAAHPVPGILLLTAIVAWRPIKFILEVFIGSFVAGLGLRAAGLFRRRPEHRRTRYVRQHPPRQPRIGYRREGRYFPWQEHVTNCPKTWAIGDRCSSRSLMRFSRRWR